MTHRMEVEEERKFLFACSNGDLATVKKYIKQVDNIDREVVRLCRSKVLSRFRSNDAVNEGVLNHLVRSLSYNQPR